jgi:hypothetical protein
MAKITKCCIGSPVGLSRLQKKRQDAKNASKVRSVQYDLNWQCGLGENCGAVTGARRKARDYSLSTNLS